MRASRWMMTSILLVAPLVVNSCTGTEPLAPAGSPVQPADLLSVRLSSETETLALGSSTQLSAQVVNQFNIPRAQIIEWSSTDLSIVDVSRTGLVTAVGPGATKVIARAAGATPDTATILVESSIASLSVYPEAVSAFEGDSLKFSASATLASGSPLESPKVTWSSSDTTIALVDASGFVTSVGSGDVSINADYLGVRASAAVNVREGEIASVSVTPSNKTMYVNSQTKLHASLRDKGGRTVSRSNLLWKSSNTSVATVANDGTVSGKGVGYSIITVESGEKGASATINVLGAPATTVAVTIPVASISAGQSVQATANLVDKDGNVLTGRQIAWQSSNPSVATVTSSGVVTGIAAGNVTISAIVDAIVGRASLSVVSALPTAVRIDPSSASLTPAQSVQLTAVETDQNGNTIPNHPVTWSSSNTAVATVFNGRVSAVAQGSAVITAVVDGLTATAQITVSSVPATSLVISPSFVSLQSGQSAQLSSVARDAAGNILSNRAVTWLSANPTVATVSAAGQVTAIAGGSVVITGKVDGVTATATVNVASTAPTSVASVEIVLPKTTLTLGETMQPTAVLRDSRGTVLVGRQITWDSDPGEIAGINRTTGLMTATEPGSTTITAESEGVTSVATVNVNSPPPNPVATVSVSATSNSLTVNQTSQLNVVLSDAAGATLSGRTIAYSSSNSAVASVSASGLVTGKGAGSVTITATSEGKSGSVGITVAGSAAVATVAVSVGSASLNPGQTTQATAVAKDASGNVITGKSFVWNSSNTSVATVNASGFVTAVAGGMASIVATVDNKAGSATVNVAGSTPSAVSSVSLTLGSASLAVGATTQASVVVRDAQGNVLTNRPVSYSSSNTSIASVSGSGLVTALVAGTASIRATVDGVMGSSNVTVSAPTAPQPPPTGAIPIILSILGQTKTRTETAALGGNFAKHDQLFDQYLPTQNNWEDNYYDRGVVYYARYARTGDVTFLNKAHAIVLAYRQQYLEPNSYGTSPHWSQVRGLEIHYRLTGDTLSRRAVAGMYAMGMVNFVVSSGGGLADIANTQGGVAENRIQARVLQAALSAYRMGASYTRPDGYAPGGAFSPATWPTRLRDILTKILSTQNADGSYSWLQICGGQLNYMVGMLNDVLVEYYRDFEADPRIPVAVEKANEYLWTTQWLPASEGFKYASVPCAPNQFGYNVGGPEPAGDLNGLVISSFGWLYQRTGDPKWRTRGDAIMSGMANTWATALTGSKQFNQAFAESYRYLAWR